MEYELYLTDLIDRKTLQNIQDAFSRMTGIAALTTDTNGIAVTNGSNFSDFCMEHTRNSPMGCIRCAQCDKSGAELALKEGKSTVYECHAGLLDFAAPIIADGKLVGCFIGGQVLTQEPEEEKIKQIAKELDIDPDEYYEAAKKVKIVDKESVDNAAKFLSTIADVLSDMAYNKYVVYQAKMDLERTSNMKSDFLANMSHEIRTPMNAVIGMAEMALREDLPSAAKNYINQIKEAGKSLLTIINDILDFSKIESGKMDINVIDYEPMSVVTDVTNIVMTRLKGKDVELILDISPNIPDKLLGDNIRIKQVLLNIANNAAKFTSKGKITIKMDYARTGNSEIELHVSVEDTGIGIKKEDREKLFHSFQQLDSKRNRNIEGTGLGLAISKQLLTLMNGDIWVESEYEKGSTFSFVIPQKVVEDVPCIKVNDPDTRIAAGLFANPYVKERFREDIKALGVEYRELASEDELETILGEKKAFLFVAQKMFSKKVSEFIESHPEVTGVLLLDFFDNTKHDVQNLHVVKKPLFILTIAMILNEEDMHFEESESEGSEFDFIAPDAQILIVDDNAVNLTVAEGLLEPLKMEVDTATSGKEAIDKISQQHYDLVFMDHMMPELDGVETTRIIRRFHQEYNDVPIIALTANAVEGTKEMFCQEGMNDFVAKPIELRILVSKVRQWLPIEKIQKTYMMGGTAAKENQQANIQVGDLDVAFALKFLGNEDLFWSVLKVYYKAIEKKAKLIKELEEAEDWTAYTIEVHALKSSSKQIGAITLSDRAAALEQAGNARNSAFIHKHTDRMLQQYLSYRDVFAPFCPEEEEDNSQKEKISTSALLKYFSDMRAAVEDLDMDKMEEVIQEMNHYSYEDWQQEMFKQMKDAVEEIDVDSCETILQEWENKLFS
ncbi:MAG: PocR ligand-binding domain-containing protein [Bacillus sp. (in: Bacteria)]|nr:PocR ligand-binding domain-containing protein [Bacillus sp. (in: firmicutes)]MCM1426544.1 PocR ligand-binding domain-containing protein [Eubacterium sp.]